MNAARIKVIFKQSVDLSTVQLFAVMLEVFGGVYRTHNPRSIGVIPADARKASGLRLQLAEWEAEGAVESWKYAA
ncbi:MAG TPA: hypothetical protein VE756_14305 [Burkholderiales bacterium]|jgi:hypothetical protein|nr:hypothetical protein [Burkholderiales bacterium]